MQGKEGSMALMYSENNDDFLFPKILQIRKGQNVAYYRSFNPDYTELRPGQELKKQDFPSESSSSRNRFELKPYTDNEDTALPAEDLVEDYKIFLTKSQNYMTKFHVPSCFHALIIGAKGRVKDKIEKETSTSIKIPKRGELGDVVITGNSEQNVASARTRIDMMLIKKRDQHPPTHFLSIPAVSASTRENFQRFKEEVLKSSAMRGVDETVFQNPNKMHLTITTLVLLDDVEVENALTIFYGAKESVINSRLERIRGLKLKIKGLEIMNDDPTEVHVLYGKVELANRELDVEFQSMIDEIAEYFAQKGLVEKQREGVKLHVTLMNSSFRNRNDNNQEDDLNVGRGRRESFDASEILRKYRDFYFGEVEAENLHFSIRFTTGDDLYYKPVSIISLRNT